jgi:hypothetical protein
MQKSAHGVRPYQRANACSCFIWRRYGRSDCKTHVATFLFHLKYGRSECKTHSFRFRDCKTYVATFLFHLKYGRSDCKTFLFHFRDCKTHVATFLFHLKYGRSDCKTFLFHFRDCKTHVATFRRLPISKLSREMMIRSTCETSTSSWTSQQDWTGHIK